MPATRTRGPRRTPVDDRVDLETAKRIAHLTNENRELEALAYAIAHDLRAPIRTIEGFSKLVLGSQTTLDAQATDYLQRVVAAAGRAGQLVDDLMSLNWLARLDLRLEEVDLSALAREVGAVLHARYPDRALAFEVEPGLLAKGDGFMLRMVIERLLDNAWKFTSTRSTATIRVGMVVEGDERAFFVQDDGAGFDMAYAHNLFRPLQRLHPPAEFDGNGLGLAIVKRIVQRHDGSVWTYAEVDRGATFFFTLGPARSTSTHDDIGGS